MGLVDYSSGSSEPDDTNSPQTKKQKTSDDQTTNSPAAKSELPPLPSAFHDLYASTVRVSASDDPALHQGRKRVNPHKVGSWPSHLYIEWHPTPTERATLTTLLSTLQSSLTSPAPPITPPPTITSFLTSDLGAPQPLHISLSRPIVLSTSQKDPFLSTITSRIRSSGLAPFELTLLGVEWHRTAESARSFLVLRVAGAEDKTNPNPNPRPNPKNKNKNKNPQLATLLRRANAVVTDFGQPALYAFKAPSDEENTSKKNKPASTTAHERASNKGEEKDEGEEEDTAVDTAFHISIAWSFAAPSPELRRLTEGAFHSTTGDGSNKETPTPSSSSSGSSDEKRADEETPTTTTTTTTTIKDAVSTMRIRVDGIKAKIGNIVTHVPLPDGRHRRHNGSGEGGRGLFGF
ncbi:U6 snRNA phosphodiesterase Usb1 [Xylaria cf. heliscus]|nr:U6 snRNA phosphodiesterase Usb1 [Xylaria cf. heliscus]